MELNIIHKLKTYRAGSKVKLLAAVLASSCFSSSAYSTDKIQLVSFEDPPYVFTKGKLKTGLTVRYIDELMWRSDMNYRMTIMPAKRALLYALNTPNTCVFPIARSQEREVQYSWVSPISISRHGFFKSSKSELPPIRVLNDAKDLRIGSYLGSAIGEYLSSMDFNVDYASDNRANILKLNAERIDLWASDTLTAKFIANQENKDLASPELVFFTTVKAMGCHPDVDSKVIQRLNDNLKAMYQDGTIERISNTFENKM